MKDDWPADLPKTRPEQHYGVSWNVILGKTAKGEVEAEAAEAEAVMIGEQA